ncbi:type II toxin-antitoxin system YoeB family toxin [Pedobacter sp. D749]|uniref:type II toxin-antitoxin system YoeB family toxin n=1 Tax=Pedobacter sp. D749 TaxID=2856523 RepID=UPI001C573BCC|nr:type II toxin-antitoxin system YoeB family toxin [Pedobacter sp. D749]QXU43854.1 type II toxin-antitoxin system YoeB family toxin [Pedobacter sp. D749]
MGKYFIEVERLAKKDLELHYKSGDKASVKRINQIFIELSEHPETGIGNRKDRLIYKIEENIVTVTIISAFGHYGDK